MNQLVKVPEISKTMQEFSKEMTKVNIYIYILNYYESPYEYIYI